MITLTVPVRERLLGKTPKTLGPKLIPVFFHVFLLFVLQVCVKGFYKSMSRCTKCPTLPWLVTQMIVVICVIFFLVFILVRDDRKAKAKGRTLSDMVLARLKIVIGFYQVRLGQELSTCRSFVSSLIGIEQKAVT